MQSLPSATWPTPMVDCACAPLWATVSLHSLDCYSPSRQTRNLARASRETPSPPIALVVGIEFLDTRASLPRLSRPVQWLPQPFDGRCGAVRCGQKTRKTTPNQPATASFTQDVRRSRDTCGDCARLSAVQCGAVRCGRVEKFVKHVFCRCFAFVLHAAFAFSDIDRTAPHRTSIKRLR